MVLIFIKQISLNEITDEVKIDVRSKSEFEDMKLFEHHIPVINETSHNKLKKCLILAFPIILFGLLKNRKSIKNELINLSHNKTKTLVIGCSQGRLRSPIIAIYAKILGIKCLVLKGGIKQYFKPVKKGLAKWFSI